MDAAELDDLQDSVYGVLDRAAHRVDRRSGRVDIDNVPFDDLRRVCELAFRPPQAVEKVVVREVQVFSASPRELDIRAAASLFAEELSALGQGREKSLALTKIDEAVLWAVEAIRKDQP